LSRSAGIEIAGWEDHVAGRRRERSEAKSSPFMEDSKYFSAKRFSRRAPWSAATLWRRNTGFCR